MKTLPPTLRDTILPWVDDCLLHAATVPTLLDRIEAFLAFCLDYRIKLHPAKYFLFNTEAQWCGRIISADGVRFNPPNLRGLIEIDYPTNGSQLHKFLCEFQWLRTSIAGFQDFTAPLHAFMASVYASVGKRTKRAIARVSLSSLGWSISHDSTFEACKQAIIHCTTLSHRNHDKRLCIYTDASDTHRPRILTHIP